MTSLLDPSEAMRKVGAYRKWHEHLARADSHTRVVYLLHSHTCLKTKTPLTECEYSLALDLGIDETMWATSQDTAVKVKIDKHGRLIPLDSLGLTPYHPLRKENK